ncbi:MAG: bifunctional diguanylate cyclase/phosphodiesterase, partial [bacterium]
IISEFLNTQYLRIAISSIIKELCDICKIDRATAVIQNDKVNNYVPIYTYTPFDKSNNQMVDMTDKYGIDLQKNITLYNQDLKKGIAQKKEEFIKLFTNDYYLYVNNNSANNNTKISDVLSYLSYLNFPKDNSKNIKELYVFFVSYEHYFSYFTFERYRDESEFLSSSELNLMKAFANIIHNRILNFEKVKKYRNQILLKDIILNNEKIPMAIVEKDSFKIVEHNEFYKKILPNIKTGVTYHSLFGHDENYSKLSLTNQIINNIEYNDRYWIKKTTPFLMSNGKEAYMIYAKDSLDYINQLDILDILTKSLSYKGLSKHYTDFIQNDLLDYALCTLDIDKFKYVNNNFGFKAGDEILQQTALVIREFLDKNEVFCRINEDKFAIMFLYESDEKLIEKINALMQAFSEMQQTYFSDKRLNFVFGITKVDKEKEINILLDHANIARKSVKGSHKSTYTFYDSNIEKKATKELLIEKRMSLAIQNDEFTPYLQPKFDLETKQICGAEALVRWITPEYTIYPDEFIPLFEQNGFIRTLDFVIYEKVMKYLRKCLDNNLKVYPISLNVSRNHIQDQNFTKKITDLINKYNIPLELLELEVTESIFVEDKERLKHFIDQIKKENIKVSIDDFGTAYSSLHVLTDINVDVLKIDKGFLYNIDNNTKSSNTNSATINKDVVIIKNIINMAKELDFQVICEGVETEEQIELLKSIGCSLGQGYVFARPMPIEDYEKEYIL